MPKPNGTMTFEEFLIEEIGENTIFDEGDNAEVFLRLGNEYLEEEFRKEERARLKRLRKNRRKTILLSRSRRKEGEH